MAEGLSPEERARSDRALFCRFLALEETVRARTVLLYWGVRAEPATQGLIRALLDRGKRVALPVCLPGGQLEARQITACDQVRPAAFGLLEPPPAAPRMEKDELDLILAPALCCDRQGTRLGQGGGFYDRYLADYRGPTAALCREVLLRETLPRGAHDIPVGLVVTENRLLRPARQNGTEPFGSAPPAGTIK